MQTLNLNIPDHLLPLVKVLSQCHSYIAGGAVRSIYNKEPISDIDVFTLNTTTYKQLLGELIKFGFHQLFQNPMLTRFSFDISKDTPIIFPHSIILDAVTPRQGEYLLTQGMPEEVITKFDFTISRAAILNPTTVLVDEDFEVDCKKKRLRIRHIVCPLSSVKRIAKYVSKGYAVSNKEILKLFLEWQSRGEQSEQLAYLLQKKNPTADEIMLLTKWIYID